MFKFICVSYIIFLAMLRTSKGQHLDSAFAHADTSGFSVTREEGWGLLNSYISHYSGDTAQLKLILQHDSSVTLTNPQPIGKLKDTRFYPTIEQAISFKVLYTTYNLTIKAKGECLFPLNEGAPPVGTLFIIPLKVVLQTLKSSCP